MVQGQPRLGTSQLTPPSARLRSPALPTGLSPRDPPPAHRPTRGRGLTVPMQSVRLGGGALGFALPKKRFMAAVGLRLGGGNNDRAGPEAQHPLRACALVKPEALPPQSTATSGHPGSAANCHWLCGGWAVLSRAHSKGHSASYAAVGSVWKGCCSWLD